MYNRLVGHYSLSSLKSYLFPLKNPEQAFCDFLSINTAACSFHGNARNALYQLIQALYLNNSIKKVALPLWTCSILSQTLSKIKGVEVIYFDVNAKDLKISIDEVIASDVDAIILIAENGMLYSKEDLQRLKNSGKTIIYDLCLALRNFKIEGLNLVDFIIFSGGFSKPISALELGVLVSNKNIEVNKSSSENKVSLNKIILLFAHIIFQNRLFYRLIHKMLPKNSSEEFTYQTSYSKRSLSLFVHHLKNHHKNAKKWSVFYQKMDALLKVKQVEFDLKSMPTKVLVPDNKIASYDYIEFHQQFSWLNTVNLKKYPKTRNIVENYQSISVNYTAVNNGDDFMEKLKKSLLL